MVELLQESYLLIVTYKNAFELHIPHNVIPYQCRAVCSSNTFANLRHAYVPQRSIFIQSLWNHFLPFLPAPANLPRFPRLDFGLCKGPLGGPDLCEALPSLDGLKACFGTSGSVLSLASAIVALGVDVPSST